MLNQLLSVACFLVIGAGVAAAALWFAELQPRADLLREYETSLQETFVPEGAVDPPAVRAAFRQHELAMSAMNEELTAWRSAAASLPSAPQRPNELESGIVDFKNEIEALKERVNVAEQDLTEADRKRLKAMHESKQLRDILQDLEINVSRLRRFLDSLDSAAHPPALHGTPDGSRR